MDSKTLWTVVVTALVVALLTSLITVKLTGNVVNVRTGSEQQVYTKLESDSLLQRVNATSCKGDSTCEVGRGSYSVPSLVFGDNNAGVFSGSDNRLEFLINKFTAFQIYPDQIRVPRGSAGYPGVVWMDNTNTGLFSSEKSNSISFSIIGNEEFTIGSGGNITASGFKGNGNAYVCVNSLGKLYRSSATCTFK